MIFADSIACASLSSWQHSRYGLLETTRNLVMSVRTYNPRVRVGNWSEDICLEEDVLKDFLEKKENGELLMNKTQNLMTKILGKVDVTNFSDGLIHFGDRVCLYNPETASFLSANVSPSNALSSSPIPCPCDVSSSRNLKPQMRNTFAILPSDSSVRAGDVLTYGAQFQLESLLGNETKLYLQSERATFAKCAKLSRKQEVTLGDKATYQSDWKVICYDPQERMESEGEPVPAGRKLILNHCKTNQNLSTSSAYSLRTAYGRELEVMAHTEFDAHKAEVPGNHWVFVQESENEREGVVTMANLEAK